MHENSLNNNKIVNQKNISIVTFITSALAIVFGILLIILSQELINIVRLYSGDGGWETPFSVYYVRFIAGCSFIFSIYILITRRRIKSYKLFKIAAIFYLTSVFIYFLGVNAL